METTTKLININREKLIILSNAARELQQEECEGMTINEILIEEFYTDAKNTEFHTFGDWRKKGMSVKKGEKAFLIWGRKRDNKEAQPEKEEPKQDEEGEKYRFFPLCYLFSNAQVQKQGDDK